MWRSKQIDIPSGFNFKLTVQSHGWYDLPPFLYEEHSGVLEYVFLEEKKGIAIHAGIREKDGGLEIRLDRAVPNTSPIVDNVRHMLRLDEPFGDFHDQVSRRRELHWVTKLGGGRLLRSPTVFEDLIKTLCTTNCSWGLTRSMVAKLVNELGTRSKNGSKAFPSVESFVKQDESFYRNVIRAGYRSPYFVELASAVVSGKLDPESWLDPEIPVPDLRKQIKSIKGFGDYAADNLLKLLGRYDGLALDSWLRAQFYKKHNRGKACADKKIEKFYREFGDWKGLAIWCDLTEDWHNK